MPASEGKKFCCQCGKSFDSLNDLKQHLEEMIDVNDFEIHEVAEC